ncbi:radical SAM protein [Candidatus Magnetomorum sp. HK-1]|nr:radical SAM protein [Candidatus Magnetomorum sp. HK-1]
MLKFILNKKKDQYIIDFDILVEPEITKFKEFKQFLNLFLSKKDTSIIKNDKKEIKQIAGNLSSFLEIIDEVFPNNLAKNQKELLSYYLSKNPSHKQGLEINFHQKPFDSPFRYWSFILKQDNFIDYFFNRINWYAGPKNEFVTSFPLHVDIESSSSCNMNCPMCYRSGLKETGHMDMDLFKKAVDECAEHNIFSIRLSWRGETLSHPRIKEMIAYSTKKIKNVSFLTNAFYLNDDIIDCLIENKVSYIAVSFDGIDNIYETIRYPAKFEENYQKLNTLISKRNAQKSNLPQIRLCTIWPAIKENPQAYYDRMKYVSDYIVQNPYINFAGPMTIKKDFICQYPWERIVIAFNGKTQCCTGWNADDIILGNIKDMTIYKMWHSDMMNQIRKIHKNGKRMDLNSCAKCRHGSVGDPNVNIYEIIKRKY